MNEVSEMYKLLTGTPAIDAVSRASMGELPLTDQQYRMAHAPFDPTQIDMAYMLLFKALDNLKHERLDEDEEE